MSARKIEPGQVCIILRAVNFPDRIGSPCTFIGYGSADPDWTLVEGTDCVIDVPGMSSDHPNGYYCTNSAWLLPVGHDPDAELGELAPREVTA